MDESLKLTSFMSVLVRPKTRLLPVAVIEISSGRSEEHTSELQSPVHLVCRLLLEKKKKRNNTSTPDTPQTNQNYSASSSTSNRRYSPPHCAPPRRICYLSSAITC